MSYSYNPGIFAACLITSYCNFSSLILASIGMISFYILSERFFPKHKELSDAGVTSIAKTGYRFEVLFL